MPQVTLKVKVGEQEFSSRPMPEELLREGIRAILDFAVEAEADKEEYMGANPEDYTAEDRRAFRRKVRASDKVWTALDQLLTDLDRR